MVAIKRIDEFPRREEPSVRRARPDNNGAGPEAEDGPAADRPIETINGGPALVLPGDGRPCGDFARDLGRMLARQDVFRRQGCAFKVNLEDGCLEPVTPEFLRTYAERFVVCLRKSRGRNGKAIRLKNTMTRDTANAVVVSSQFHEELRPIESLAPARMPVLRVSGAIELRPPGYDPESRVFTNSRGPELDRNMPLDEAKATIDDALSEFPFAHDGGRSKAVAVAAMLTVFAAGILPAGSPRPCFIIIANGEGSGKTVLLMLVAASHGRCQIGTAPTDEEEWRKLMMAAVVSGRGVIAFDNIKGHLGSPALEAYLTSARYSGRILGATREFTGDANATVLVTGNQLTVSPDMRRRSLFVELAMGELRSEDRVFKRVLDEAAILELRPRLMAALWAIVREWDRAGRPGPTRSNSSFPRWCASIGGATEFAGFGCPCGAAEIKGAADTDTTDMQSLLEAMKTGKGYDFQSLVALCADRGLFDRFMAGMKEGLLTPRDRSTFAKLLARYDGRRDRAGRVFVIRGQGKTRRYLVAGDNPQSPGTDSILEGQVDKVGQVVQPSLENTSFPSTAERPIPPVPPIPPEAGGQMRQAPTGWLLVKARDALGAIAEEIVRSGGPVAADIETYGPGPKGGLDPWRGEIRLLSLRVPGHDPWIIDLRTVGYDLGPVGPALAGVEVIGHNIKFDALWLRVKCGLSLPRVFCTLTAARLLASGTKSGNGLDQCLERHLGIEPGPDHSGSDWAQETLADEMLRYAARDVLHLPALRDRLLAEISVAGLDRVADIEMRLIPVVVGMETAGMHVDRGELERVGAEACARADQLAGELRTALEWPDLNPNSHSQLKAALSAKGIAVESTSEAALRASDDGTIVPTILEYRGAAKQAQWAASMLKSNGPDGRIHGQFVPTGTETGRFTSKEPNLQNIPRGDARRCFTAAPGHRLVVADYSQIELRAAAAIAGEKRMIEAFARGDDLHRATAAAVLGKPVERITKDDRQLAKAVNFGLLFGQGARGLVDYATASYGVALTIEEAERIRGVFFDTYAGLKAWHDRCWADARSGSSETRTRLGRRRIIPPDATEWRRFTALVNTPVQGSCADGLKRAMLAVAGALPASTRIVATVHDELVIEAEESVADEVKGLVAEQMKRSMGEIFPEVPIEVEVQAASNWGEK